MSDRPDKQPPRGIPVAAMRQTWTCPRCGRVLGVVADGVVMIRHGERVITAQLPCVQICDRCKQEDRR